MAKLILIKHAPPLVDPARPAHRWALSEAGREKCKMLARQLAPHALARMVSSEEPKAAHTAEIVALQLDIPWETAPGLHEHDRANVPHMRSAEFISMMELFFRKPDELVLGKETANQAQARFSAAVERVIEQHDSENIAVVTHGTVMALYLAPLTNRPAFELWRDLGLPSFVVLARPPLRVIETVSKIDST
jgi:broad specificity phosphatase PhoE